ncbi:hypothetical protein AGMMS50212_10930 [Spirochaetia bacterium]|nr:hypothetical protein AGMMS50212_10930 [Spirochaetia bacterium]
MKTEERITWQDALYTKTYDEEYTGLQRRLEADPSFTADDLSSMLRHFYEMEGSDWLGRGEVQSINLSAVIAAYESFLESFFKCR